MEWLREEWGVGRGGTLSDGYVGYDGAAGERGGSTRTVTGSTGKWTNVFFREDRGRSLLQERQLKTWRSLRNPHFGQSHP